MKKNGSNKSESASKIFDEALARLSRVKTPLLVDSATKDSAFEPQISHASFRHDLIMEILRDKPGLTYEKLDKQMEESGF
jgi:hypothetical protein